MRREANERNAPIYPSYDQVKLAKSLCYPDGIKIDDTGEEKVFCNSDKCHSLREIKSRLLITINSIETIFILVEKIIIIVVDIFYFCSTFH